MDGLMDRWVGRCMDECVGSWLGGRTDVCVCVCVCMSMDRHREMKRRGREVGNIVEETTYRKKSYFVILTNSKIIVQRNMLGNIF